MLDVSSYGLYLSASSQVMDVMDCCPSPLSQQPPPRCMCVGKGGVWNGKHFASRRTVYGQFFRHLFQISQIKVLKKGRRVVRIWWDRGDLDRRPVGLGVVMEGTRGYGDGKREMERKREREKGGIQRWCVCLRVAAGCRLASPPCLLFLFNSRAIGVKREGNFFLNDLRAGETTR